MSQSLMCIMALLLPMFEHVLYVHVGFPRDVRGLRHYIIDNLEIHNESWPPACPPLETARLEHNVLFFLSNFKAFLHFYFHFES